MKKLFKSGVVIMCIFASTIFAQNFQLGIYTKSISNSSALTGDEWNFNLDTWNLYVMTPDLISRVSNQTKKNSKYKAGNYRNGNRFNQLFN